jgi:hypothetical protein
MLERRMSPITAVKVAAVCTLIRARSSATGGQLEFADQTAALGIGPPASRMRTSLLASHRAVGQAVRESGRGDRLAAPGWLKGRSSSVRTVSATSV